MLVPLFIQRANISVAIVTQSLRPLEHATCTALIWLYLNMTHSLIHRHVYSVKILNNKNYLRKSK